MSANCSTFEVDETAAADRRTLRVLIADDEPLIRRMVESTLRSHGIEDIECCAGGSAAGQCVLRRRPDLIILDVMMPGGNGLRALRQWHTDTATAAIPVIVMSGFSILTLEPCLYARTLMFLPKPFDAKGLMRAVDHVLAVAAQAA